MGLNRKTGQKKEPQGSFFRGKVASKIIGHLYEAGTVKIDFEKGWRLKSGLWTPIYVNFRLLQSYPSLLSALSRRLNELLTSQKIVFDSIASVPLGAVPIGVALSLVSGKPHILPRPGGKDHGLAAKIDGNYKKGDKILLVDDLITVATSKLEAISVLAAAGLKVKDVLVILDRQQGGQEILAKKGLRLHALFTFDDFLKELERQGKISGRIHKRLTEYLQTTHA